MPINRVACPDGRKLADVPIERIADGGSETTGTAVPVNLSSVTIAVSEATKHRAAWAATFAVSTALAGIWGMNFEQMAELKWAHGGSAALAVIASVAGSLSWRLKRSGWLSR